MKLKCEILQETTTRKVFLSCDKELSFEQVTEYINTELENERFEVQDMYKEYNRLKELYYYHITMVRKG